MKQIMTVFAFTYREAIRKKAFIISTAVVIVAIFLACVIPGLLKNRDNNEETGEQNQAQTAEEQKNEEQTGKICYYLDEEGWITDGASILQEAVPEWKILPGEKDKEQEYRDKIRESEKVSLVKITGQQGLPFITVVNKNFMSGISENTVMSVLSESYIRITLLAQGVTEETIDFAQSTLPGTVETEGAMNFSGYVLGIALVMLTFFCVYYYGYGVSMSVATEKTTRVMETLIVSAKPSRILLGKCLGMGALGLTQFGVILLFSAMCITYVLPGDMTIMGMSLTLEAFTLRNALLVVVFFLLGYALYAMMNAVCGASVSKIEDLNSAMMPVMLISLVSFYAAYACMLAASADSIWQKAVLYIPFTSPFIMPFKLLNSDVATADICISIAMLLLFIVVISLICIRIYSASVLHYGKRLKWKELCSRQ